MTDRYREDRTFGVLHRLPLLLAVLFAVALLPASGAGAGSTNAITVSGALKGTLKIVPNFNCYTVSAHNDTLSWASAKLSPRKAAPWTINIVVPGPGTWKKFAVGKVYVVLETSGLVAWVSSSGSVTVGGKGTTGSINATLGLHEGTATGTVHLTGSWSCP
ncbi:MAG TPA: hypothetical protein VED84_05735 [Acidimicrobiales bacterium]|nr:hypothetical protein [Acidimicrobiales bacterium]